MKLIEEMTLDEIQSSNDERFLRIYKKEIELLQTNKIARAVVENNYGKSIISLLEEIEEAEQKATSERFFEGQLVEMYPNIKEQRAKKPITCDFSAGIINPGSLYVSFRPLIKTINNGRAFVLKRTIKVESGYWSELPTTVRELEGLFTRAENETSDNSGIDYNHFMTTIGGCLSFQELKRRKYR